MQHQVAITRLCFLSTMQVKAHQNSIDIYWAVRSTFQGNNRVPGLPTSPGYVQCRNAAIFQLHIIQTACADQRVQHRRISPPLSEPAKSQFFRPMATPLRRSLRCCCRFPPNHYCSTRPSIPLLQQVCKRFCRIRVTRSVFIWVCIQSYSDCISGAARLFLPPDAVLLNSPGPQPRWIQFTDTLQGFRGDVGWRSCITSWIFPRTCAIHAASVILPVRITPGSHRKHRLETHRCNRQVILWMDTFPAGLYANQTAGASPNWHHCHHGCSTTAERFGFTGHQHILAQYVIQQLQ